MSAAFRLDQERLKTDPVAWVEIAAGMAVSGEEPTADAASAIAEVERPTLEDPQSARRAFWDVLAQPKRHVAIRWLDRIGLLGELIPAWEGNRVRKELRLNALEEVHREGWRKGLSEEAFSAIVDVHDVVVDRRLNRWALTALGVLLGGGDTENQVSWSKAVRRDLHNLGATEAENVWVERIVRDINPAILLLRGQVRDQELRPELAVAALSTIAAQEPGDLPGAMERADAILRGETNPLDKSGGE